jgi:hypothetical protein
MKNLKEFQKMLIKIRKIIKNQFKDKRKVSAKEIIVLDEMILFKLRKVSFKVAFFIYGFNNVKLV